MSRRSTVSTPAPIMAAPEPHAYDRIDEVAGHRVVRRYAVGSRATLLLAATRGDGDEAPAQRLIKVFHPATERREIDVEIASLSAIENAHVVRLLDLATMEPGDPPCLVLERLPGPSLASYLEERQVIDVGAAVSIVAPLCSALQSLHDAGVTHGSLQPRRVIFDASGRPVLTGFGRGVLHTSQRRGRKILSTREEVDGASAEAEWSDARRNDVRDLIELAERAFRDVDQPATARQEIFAGVTHGLGSRSSADSLTRLEAALFAIAPAQSVRLEAASRPDHDRDRARSRVGVRGASDAPKARNEEREGVTQGYVDPDESGWAIEPTRESVGSPEPRIISALRVLGASPSLIDGANHVIESASQLRRGRVQAVEVIKAPRRRLIVMAAVGSTVLATVLILLLPVGSRAQQSGASAQQAPSSAEQDSGNAHTPLDGTVVPTADPAVLAGDDPAAALAELLRADDLVTRPDGAPTEDDSPPVDDPPVVTGRWGGSALVAARLNGQPASFLLVKGEAGWRIRDVFDADG